MSETWLSGVMCTHAFSGFGFFFSWSSADDANAGRWNPINKPVPAAAPVFKNTRRSSDRDVVMEHLDCNSGLNYADFALLVCRSAAR